DLTDPPVFRAVLIRTGRDRHRFVLTSHHIVVDGWSLPILLGEIFAAYYGQRLPAAASYRRFVSWLATRDRAAGRAAWTEVLAGLESPTLVASPDRLGLGRRELASFAVSAETTRAVAELARAQHTTVNVVLQAGWAQVLMQVTGQQDVVFGAAVSGRPPEVAGAESMVGLLVNTVPVRARATAVSTVASLLGQLREDQNNTVEHQYLALAEIHRLSGHEQLFDTLFVYENYPVDTAALTGEHELAITGFSARESTHYPLAVGVIPGDQLGLRVEFDTEVFGMADIEVLVNRWQAVLMAMTADPARRLLSMDFLDPAELSRVDAWGNRAVLDGLAAVS
ncbi:condensation domain-containing protein, partial [Mycobacterium sp. 1164966.3]|uniref:condensation domain-containing protein n=1 Tax=Mycobacterium sp. 1164966.3 TaxID=1856861 RepID=UPI000B0A609D